MAEEPTPVAAPAAPPAAPAGPPPPAAPRALYFVRIPRPHLDDSTAPGLAEKLKKTVEKLKAMNANVQNKRVRCFPACSSRMDAF